MEERTGTRGEAPDGSAGARSGALSSPAPTSSSTATVATSSVTPHRTGSTRRSGRHGRRRRSGRRTESSTFQGVLYKRRDVFKKRYRPRLFVLDGEKGILTYYLLNNEHEYKLRKRAGSADDVGAETLGESSASVITGGGTRSRADTGSFTRASSASGGAGGTRPRTWTDDSHHSIPEGDAASVATGHTGAFASLEGLDATYDFDVVPRGSYYLPGCSVATDDRHSKPSEGLFAFTVTPSTEAAAAAVAAEASGGERAAAAASAAASAAGSNGGAPIHLAATSEYDRAAWVRRIAEACCKLSAHGAVARGAENAAREFREQMVARRDRAAAASAAVVADGIVEVADRDDDASSISTKCSLGSRNVLDEDKHEDEDLGDGDETKEDGEAESIEEGDVVSVSAPQERDNPEGRGSDPAETPPPPAPSIEPSNGEECPAASSGLDEGPEVSISADTQETGGRVPASRTEAPRAPAPTPNALSETNRPAKASATATPAPPRERTWSRGTAATGTTSTTFASDELSSAPQLSGPTTHGKGRGQVSPPESRLAAVRVYTILLVTMAAADIFLFSEAYLLSSLLVQPFVTCLLLLGGPLAMNVLCEDLDTYIRYKRWQKLVDRQDGSKADITLPLSQSASILSLPLLVWACGRSLGSFFTDPLFVMLAFYAVRCLAVQSLGAPLPCASPSMAAGPVTCRFAVDLRGVLRYIRNRKEERLDLQQGGGVRREDVPIADVSVTHIAVRAVALALSESPRALNCQRVCVPLLGIEGYFPNESVEVAAATSTSLPHSVASSSVEVSGTSHMVTVKKANELSAQRIADFLWREQHTAPEAKACAEPNEKGILILGIVSEWSRKLLALVGLWQQSDPAHCFCSVFTSPDSENSQVDVDVAPPQTGQPGITVLVGGVRGAGREGPSGAALAGGQSVASIAGSTSAAPRPMLSMSVTIDSPPASVAACRKFAERVQRLMQFPELCDEVA